MLSLNEIEGAETDYDIVEYPEPVKGRVAHIDADFLAHIASYERENAPLTLSECQYNATCMFTNHMRLTGSELAVLHITAPTSSKGGRYSAAIQKVYQQQRTNVDRPRHLDAMKLWMGSYKSDYISGQLWSDAEADDGMSQAAWNAWDEGRLGDVVIVTKDKDLRMCPAVHADWDTGELYTPADTFGYIEIAKNVTPVGNKTSKPRGYGTKFFWWQLLMGDTADNIQGCPKVKWSKKLLWGETKLKPCGMATAYDMLKDAKNDAECLDITMKAYKSNTMFCNVKDDNDVKWNTVLLSEAHLLWMQRTAGNENDFKQWVKEITL